MPKITFVESDGTEHQFDGDVGDKARDIAVQNGVPGIDGDCGGFCGCGTCHVYVPQDWIDKVGRVDPEATEAELLEFAHDPQENSRLSCQILLSDELDGLVLNIPVGQH